MFSPKGYPILLFFYMICLQETISVIIQPGVFNVEFGKRENPGQTYKGLTKSLFAKTTVKISVVQDDISDDTSQAVKIGDDKENVTLEYTLGWMLRYTQCEEMYGQKVNFANVLVPTEPYTIDYSYYTELSLMYPQESYISVANSTTKSFTKVSGQEHFAKSDSWVCFVKNISSEHPACLKGLSIEDFAARSHEPAVDDQVITTQMSGPYLLTLELNILKGSMKSFKVKVDLKGPHGYLSTYQYPLLKFYAVMSGVYILFCFTWVLLLCRHRQNHFAIHAWIGTILFVGLIEKISFLVKFQHMNAVGQNSLLVALFPEVVSYIRSSLARCLFLIVSIGYCITRATLGTYQYRVILTGGVYFVLKTNLALMEFSDMFGWTLRMTHLLALAVLDLLILYWIIKGIIQTMKMLLSKSEMVKFWLYVYFTCSSLLCFCFSLAFFVWSIYEKTITNCLVHWQYLWLNEAIWPILFSGIVVVVMILFRPSGDKQRFVYVPLEQEDDENDEEEEEFMMSDSFDGMQLRHVKEGKSNFSDQDKPVENEVDL